MDPENDLFLMETNENYPAGWGPEDSVQLPYFSGFMEDITIVFIGVISWFINPLITGGAYPVKITYF